jgi:hypothetical protein
MRGFITDSDFDLIDQCFPGIKRYYRDLKEKPKTFLELMWSFTHQEQERCKVSRVATSVATGTASR